LEGRSKPYLDYGSIDAGVVCLGIGAHTLWYLGYPEQALQTSREACGRAEVMSHPLSLAMALSWAARVHQLRGDALGTQERAEAVIDLARAQAFPQWAAQGTLLRGWARVELGDQRYGIEQILEGLRAWRATGAQSGVQWRLLLLADAYGQTGRADHGLTALEEALEVVQRTGDHRDEADIHRLVGKLMLQGTSPRPAEAETRFRQAIELARGQQARSYELRASLDLARLWYSQSKCTEARQLLAPLYEWFTEGFDTFELQESKALLDRIA
jgi:predicted ATPase